MFSVLWGAPCVLAGNNDKQIATPPQWTINDGAEIERGRDQGGITGRICASCLMGAKKFPREG